MSRDPFDDNAVYNNKTLFLKLSKIRDHSLFMPGGGLARIRGGHANFRTVRGGVMKKLAYKRGGGGCLILQFCFISKKCVHCCRQY